MRRVDRSRGRRAGRALFHAVSEPLERRVMLCVLHQSHQPPVELRPDLVGADAPDSGGGPAVINWINRGQASDRFGAVFGGEASLARSVVDRVLIDYMQMIESFNYSDGSTNYNLTVEMRTDEGVGGSANLATTLGGKPKSGSLSLQAGNDGAGDGFFLDPDAALNFNSAEFIGTIENPFAGDAQAGSPAAGLFDFYSLIAAEVGHCLGLFGGTGAVPLWDARTTNTGVPDNAEGGGQSTFWTFTGPNVRHLMTGFNAGTPSSFNGAVHSSGGTANINFGGFNWRGNEDAGNAIYEPSRRYLVPDTLGLMFRDAYSYTVAPVGTRDSFYTVLNRQTGELLVRGSPENGSDDHINVLVSGGEFQISVDLGTDVPGSGSLPGAGDLPAYTSSFQTSLVTSIRVEGLDGDDDILFDAVPANVPVIIDGGSGNDFIRIGDGSNTLNGIDSNLTIFGSTGTNTLLLVDTTGDAFDHTYTFDVSGGNTTFDRTSFPLITISDVQEVEVAAGGGFDTFNVNRLSLAVDLSIFAGGGNDTINLAAPSDDLDNIAGDVSIFGEAGADILNLFDTLDTSASTFNLIAGGVDHVLDRGTFGSASFGGSTEAVNVSTGSSANTFNLRELNSLTTLTINAGGGNDSATIGSTTLTLNPILGNVVFNGEGGTDTIELDDQTNAVSGLYVVTDETVDRTGFGLLTFETSELVTLNGGSATNPYDIDPATLGLSTDVTINAGPADDLLSITPTLQRMELVGNADLTFNGGGGSDQLYLFDGGSSFVVPYLINSTSVTRGLAPVDYNSVEFISIDGSTGANDFTVSSLIFSTDIGLAGNAGNDRLFVGGTSQVLGNVDGTIDFLGGPGTDSMEMRDTGTTNATTYVLFDNTFDSLEFSFLTYATAESLVVNGGPGANTWRATTTLAGVNYTFNAGAAGDTFHLGTAQNHIDTLDGPLTVNAGGGTDTVNVNDSAETGAFGFTLTNTTLTRSGMAAITYSAVDGMNINAGNVAGSAAKVHNIESTSAGTQIVLNAGSGNDIIRLSNTATLLSNLQGSVVVNGQGGTDSLTAQDQANASDDTYSIDATTLQTDDSALVTYGTVESFIVNAGGGDSDIDISSSAAGTPITVNAGPGNDSLNISQLNDIDAAITVNGNAGVNVLFIDDRVAGNDAYALSATTLARTGFGGLTYGTITDLVLLAQTGNNTITVNSTDTTVRIDANQGTDTILVVETVSQGEVLLTPSAGNDIVNVNFNGVGSAGVVLDASHTFGSLHIGAGGFVLVFANGSHVVRTASLTVNGSLDLSDNTMIVDYPTGGPSPFAAIRTALTSGYAGGAWNGSVGIKSSRAASSPGRALGYAESSAIFSSFPAIFVGQQVDDSTVLIRYTRYGDGNLDRQVNLADYNRLSANFGQNGTSWSQGNFNFDNTTNLADYNLLTANFGLPV